MPGIGFDCASAEEMSLALSLNTPPHKIIYANPCKGIRHLKYAKKNGIKMLVFDSENELLKIKKYFRNAELVIRIMVEEFGAIYSLKEKFGASLETAKDLLIQAKELFMNVIGVSFHVGSSSKSPNAHYFAIKNCRELFDFAKKELNYDFQLLDIGGGFSPLKKTEFDEFSLFQKSAKSINEALNEYFPEVFASNTSIRVIAEPGTYYAQRAFLLAVSVTNKKIFSNGRQLRNSNEKSERIDKVMYYLNEGVFSQFIAALFEDMAHPVAAYSDGNMRILHESSEGEYNSVL